jgi:hypothetical protein
MLGATNLFYPIAAAHYVALVASLVPVWSFIMATPILFVGWLWQRRR